MSATLHDRIRAARLVPVIKLDRAEDAVPLAEALVSGGLAVAEVTFRTAAAAESIHAIRKRLPSVLVGAGTILKTEDAQKAIDAGASFLVSPGFNPKIVEFSLEKRIPIVPGVATPSEIEAGLSYSLEVLKLFPAEVIGGVGFLKAVRPVYSAVSFMPTGGINEANVLSYLELPNVLACGGSWMVKPELIASGRFDEITALTKRAVELVR